MSLESGALSRRAERPLIHVGAGIKIPLKRGDKILDYDEIVVTAKSLQAAHKTIVHCHGVYDLLHVGHIKHLEAARRLGDVLIVTITPDHFVDKGSHRPAFTETLRAEAL